VASDFRDVDELTLCLEYELHSMQQGKSYAVGDRFPTTCAARVNL